MNHVLEFLVWCHFLWSASSEKLTVKNLAVTEYYHLLSHSNKFYGDSKSSVPTTDFQWKYYDCCPTREVRAGTQHRLPDKNWLAVRIPIESNDEPLTKMAMSTNKVQKITHNLLCLTTRRGRTPKKLSGLDSMSKNGTAAQEKIVSISRPIWMKQIGDDCAHLLRDMGRYLLLS